MPQYINISFIIGELADPDYWYGAVDAQQDCDYHYPNKKSRAEIRDHFFIGYTAFKKEIRRRRDYSARTAPVLKRECNAIHAERVKAKNILDASYAINIVPSHYRNIYAVYYLYDFITTSREAFSTALLHFDLQEIKARLDRIIEQQEEIIINQERLLAQNSEIMSQNQQHLKHLAGIERNTAATANAAANAETYAQVAARNAEACAWFELARFLS